MLTIQTKMRRIAMKAILAVLAGFPACAQSLQEHMSTCFACHGEKGQSQLPEVPSLGAQPAFYTLVELVMFRDKLRIAEPMNEMTKGLSDDDLRAVSDIIAKLPPPNPVSDTPDPARMDRGRALAQQNRCNFCHQSNFQGLDNVPGLAGQREDYLLKSLRAYKDNSRRGYDAQMSEVVYAMKDGDFVDLAYFLARVPLRPWRNDNGQAKNAGLGCVAPGHHG
jgi:cytochrome c553